MILFFGILVGIGMVLQIITALIGTCYYYKYQHVPLLNYFVFLLWYVPCNEIVSYYGLQHYLKNSNAIMYNIYHLINFSYLLILYSTFLKKKSKKTVTILTIIYILSVIVNGFYENYFLNYQSVPYIIAAVSLIIAIILYFIEILNSKKVLYTDKILLFWISFGLLLYYVGTIPFRILLNYYESLSDATVSFLLNFSLTIIMNLFFIIGFVWSNDKQQG